MPRDLSYQHQVIATTHEVGEAGMAQNMGRHFQIRISTELTKHQIDSPGRESPPLEIQKQGAIRERGEAFGTLFESVLERLAHFSITGSPFYQFAA